MKLLSRTFAVAGGAAVLLASTGATVAQAASVTVPKEGTLVAGGAGVNFSVSFDCQAGWTGRVSAEVAQTVRGNRLATGFALSDDIDCIDGAETVEVTVMGVGDFAFTEGEALVRVSMFL